MIIRQERTDIYMNLQNNKLNEIGHMLAHDKHTNPNVDPEKESVIDREMTKLNQNLFERNDGLTDKEFVEKAVKESPTFAHWKSNYNALSTWCIQIPKEFSGSYEEKNEIFKEMVNFTADRYGRDNIVSAWTHFDEVRNREGIEKENGKSLIPLKEREHCQDHIHIRYVPRTEDGRISTKEVTPRKELRDYQREMQQHLREKFPEHAHELNFLNGATKDKSKDLARQAQLNHEKNLEEKEQLKQELEREQRRNERALDKKEKDIEKKQEKVDKNIEILNKNREIIDQTREAAERIKDIRIVYFEIPEPDGKGLKKGTYSKEQVEKLVKEINKAREQTRTIEQGREVKSFDERLEQASKRANENVKDKTIDRLREENERLKTFEKDHNFCIWLDKNYNVKEIKKEYERQEKEHEKELTHTHSRTYDRDR